MGSRWRIARLGTLALAFLAAAGRHPPYAMPVHEFQLRSPQVPVHSTDLELLLFSRLERLAVARDQVDAELLQADVFQSPSLDLLLEVRLVQANGRASGVYDGHATLPGLMPVFPDTAEAEWFALVDFRQDPRGVTVLLFDEQLTLLSTTSYPGGDRSAIGIFGTGPGGAFYSQDARNSGASPQVLFFCGTDQYRGGWWVAGEDRSPGGGPEADFDDVVWYVEGGLSGDVQGGGLTSVHHASWGQVKARFR